MLWVECKTRLITSLIQLYIRMFLLMSHLFSQLLANNAALGLFLINSASVGLKSLAFFLNLVAKIFPLCKLEASRPIFVWLQSEPQPSKNPMSHLRKNPSNNLKPNTAGNASNTNACSGNQFMTSAKSIKASRNCQVQ